MPSIVARATISHNGERRRRRRARGLTPEKELNSPPVSRTPYANLWVIGSSTPIKVTGSVEGHQTSHNWVSQATIPRGQYISHVDIVVEGETPLPPSSVNGPFQPMQWWYCRVKGTKPWFPLYTYGGVADSRYQPLSSRYTRYGWYAGSYWQYGFIPYYGQWRRRNHFAFKSYQQSANAAEKKAVYRLFWHHLRMSYAHISKIALLQTDPSATVAQQRLGTRYSAANAQYREGAKMMFHINAGTTSTVLPQQPMDWSIRHPNFPKYYFNFTCL